MIAFVSPHGPSAWWYATRGSGIVALLLLTASLCLGVLSAIRWRSSFLPRFVVAGLHRNLTLLAVAFLVLHVLTTIADGFAPIGLRDAFVPFVSPYRPLWLGLGTVGCDLLLALLVTSLLRGRIGYRGWRAVHGLAYVAWPVALVHALGTGSDARVHWFLAVALGSAAAVAAAVVARVAASAPNALRAGALVATIGLAAALVAWYRTGPGRSGWAARAGTPGSLLAAPSVRWTKAALPRTFTARLRGRATESFRDRSGLVTVRIDTTMSGGVRGRLRLALRGFPSDEGGVMMTSSGVAFAASGVPAVLEGEVVGLDGPDVRALVSAPSTGPVDLAVALNLDPTTARVTGTVHGSRTAGG